MMGDLVSVRRRSLCALLATVAIVGTTALAVPATAGTSDVTSAVEAARVDRVPTPTLRWHRCDLVDFTTQCALVRLPLDYDDPDGEKIDIALARIPARDQKNKIGSLFMNPGGPGGSGVQYVRAVAMSLDPALLDRFDLIGVDPRGVGASEQTRCFSSSAEQREAYAEVDPFLLPLGPRQEADMMTLAAKVGRGCSKAGNRIVTSVSTAETARDMDVLRRAVGDRRLTYYGISYGTVLGQYYANMFPDRVRAIAVDGVVNPVDWIGQRRNTVDLFNRVRSAEASEKAFLEWINRCDSHGAPLCAFAANGSASEKWSKIINRLKREPIVIDDPTNGRHVLDYSRVIHTVRLYMYVPQGVSALDSFLSGLHQAMTTGRVDEGDVAARLLSASNGQREFAYLNGLEALWGVVCTDTTHPSGVGDWPGLAEAAEKRAPNFGRAWSWLTAACGARTWTATDKSAYTGPFNRRTANPVLFIGNYWDPATHYENSLSANQLLPGSHLIRSDSWGHGAYGTSRCATQGIVEYLINGTPPAETVCRGDYQPFEKPAPGARLNRVDLTNPQPARPGEPQPLPPVFDPFSAMPR